MDDMHEVRLTAWTPWADGREGYPDVTSRTSVDFDIALWQALESHCESATGSIPLRECAKVIAHLADDGGYMDVCMTDAERELVKAALKVVKEIEERSLAAQKE